MTNSLSSLPREAVAALAARLRPYLRVTPVVEVEGADLGRDGVSLFLKLELLQHAGSFKARGAFANLLLRDVPAAGVVAASGGNHGVAVAHAARRLGVRARIFVPTVASPAKIARIRADGAELVIGGALYADALAASQAWTLRSGAMPIHAFDQTETLLGQATLARELAAQVPDLDTVVVAVGGGGLIGGVAGWFGGQTRVVGVEPEKAPTLTAALAAGHPVDAEAGGIAADSLAPRRVGTLTFPIAQAHVERVLLVTDDEIRAAQRVLWDRLRLVAEPGGATALAGVLSAGYHARPGERIAVVVCGGNTEAVDFDRPARIA